MKEKLNLTTLSKKEIKTAKGGVRCFCTCSGQTTAVLASNEFANDWP